MLSKLIFPTVLATVMVLLHTFVGTVTGAPQRPELIHCKGQAILDRLRSVPLATYAATTPEAGHAKVLPLNVQSD
ncbi:hypothetical protein F5050DRAFT_1810103 [Lentinula boryana]|uniref:Secreted protein n=1 Tax=Lentinula boryana TaxID=40481 RepID=A0ABQ8Q5V9_9AGAR|nr:hypothetical protein F5050DRAFT_1810103 [Lentinula boryana]